MIYLAGPIDRVSPNEASTWRKYAAGKLTDTCFDPYAAFGSKANPTDPKTVQAVNVAAIDECTLMLANIAIPGGGVTYDEIDYALDRGLHVVIYSTEQQRLLTDRGAVVVDSLGEAIAISNKLRMEPNRVVDGEGLPVTTEKELFAGMSRDEPKILLFMVDEEACGDYVPDLPQLSYDGDVGFDLPAAESCVLIPHTTTSVRLAFRVEPPAGYYWRLVGRSSTWRNLDCEVKEGIIDGGYRGPLWAGIRNPNDDPVYISQGDRLVQCIVCKDERMKPVLATQLTKTERGESGFGSSGQ